VGRLFGGRVLDTKNLYEKLGASASKAGLHQALNTAGVADHSGLFAKINRDLAGNDDFASFLHCDGAGTKTLVAYLMYRETGETKWFSGLADDALVMNLDDVFCLGTPETLLLANTIARNARLIPDEALAVIIGRYRELSEKLAALGITIELSGGETADCGDTVRTLVVDAVVAGRIARAKIIDPKNICPGDVIVGLASTGQASYENRPNSGIGSNGLTLARHALMSDYYQNSFLEASDSDNKGSHTYRGSFRLTDQDSELGMQIGEALLSPTRTFAPILAELYAELGNEIHGVIHVTGGGLTKVSRFGPETNHYLKDNPFPAPAIFRLIQEQAQVPWREMYQVFNMGQRIEIYLPEKAAAAVQRVASRFGVDSRVIGRVTSRKVDGSESRVRVESEHGAFDY